MTVERLTQIIKIANKKTITNRIKELGYINCARHRKLGRLGIVTLFGGDMLYTEVYPDSTGKFTYEGSIVTGVQGYEQYEFILVNINDNKKVFPVDLLIWAKEAK